MSNAAEIPILVGVGDINDRAATRRDDAAEPLTLMLRAIGAAIQDTTLAPEAAQKLQSAIESVSVVANWTWPYPNAPDLLVQRLGLPGAVHTHESHHGGDSPGQLFDEAARRVAYKKSKVAVVTGAEALASCSSRQ
jgi:acetyl-CoA acetyltransferase